MKYLFTLSYNGGHFYGSQKQAKHISVQECLVSAIEAQGLTCKQFQAVGRTDAGVHSSQFQCTLEIKDLKIPASKLAIVLQRFISDEKLKIISVAIACQHFLPRYHTRVRHYRYTLTKREAKRFFPIQLNSFSHPIKQKLNINRLNEYFFKLCGSHDFSTFCAISDSSKHKTREIFSINLSEDFHSINIDIYGNAFLKNQIRSMVANILDLYYQKKSPDYVTELLQAKDNKRAKKRAPAKGLNLRRVFQEKLFGNKDYYK